MNKYFLIINFQKLFIVRLLQRFKVKLEKQNDEIQVNPTSLLFNAVPKVIIFEKI